MQYQRLGKSGLQVSRIVLGCMGFGDRTQGTTPWALTIDEARPIVKAALDAGVTTFDTANYYSYGASEAITGKLIKELANRDEVL